MVALEGKSIDITNHIYCPGTMNVYKMSWQFSQQLWRFFNLDQNYGPTELCCHLQRLCGGHTTLTR